MDDERSRRTAAGKMLDKIAFQRSLYDAPNPTRRYLHRRRRDLVSALVAAHGNGEGTAIEVGVGAGTYGEVLRASFARVVRLDREGEYLRPVRREQGPALCVRGDAFFLPFPDEVFDLVLFSEVIEHLPPGGTTRALRELSRVLRPRGVIVLSTPQRYSFVERAAKLLAFPFFRRVAEAFYGEGGVPFEGGILEHVNLMTRKEFLRRANEAGLVALDSTTCGVYLPFLAEFGGEAGARIALRLESRCRTGVLASVLWTQIHVLAKSSDRREPEGASPISPARTPNGSADRAVD